MPLMTIQTNQNQPNRAASPWTRTPSKPSPDTSPGSHKLYRQAAKDCKFAWPDWVILNAIYDTLPPVVIDLAERSFLTIGIDDNTAAYYAQHPVPTPAKSPAPAGDKTLKPVIPGETAAQAALLNASKIKPRAPIEPTPTIKQQLKHNDTNFADNATTSLAS
ncbi:hypothetical protein J3F83DRAFT_712787 [Trichoderma novae-zelandiae]